MSGLVNSAGSKSGVINPVTNIIVEFLVIAGGSGASQSGGAGGGYRLGTGTLFEPSGGNSSPEIPLTVIKGTTYTVTVGVGGSSGQNGLNSQFASILSFGGTGTSGETGGVVGGSGHGGHGIALYGRQYDGTLQTSKRAETPGQGCLGGYAGINTASYRAGGGGGGAGSRGGDGESANASTLGGNGGHGLTSSITGSAVGRAGGGGGCTLNGSSNPGSAVDGGGAGSGTYSANASTVNTGGGGGGAGTGGTGALGLVVISYLNTYPSLVTIHSSHVCNGQSAGGSTAPAASTSRSGYKTYSFTAGDGNISW